MAPRLISADGGRGTRRLLAAPPGVSGALVAVFLVAFQLSGLPPARRGIAGEQEPSLPKLPVRPPAVAAPSDGSSRKLPAVATVCRDPVARRCWTSPGETTCASADAPSAEPLRVVPDTGNGAELLQALQHCEESLRQGESERGSRVSGAPERGGRE